MSDLRTSRIWERKLKQLAQQVARAQEDLLVGVYEARQDRVSQADVAAYIGDRSSSGVKAKENKGRAIKEKRKRGPKQS